jgi:serine protease Do
VKRLFAVIAVIVISVMWVSCGPAGGTTLTSTNLNTTTQTSVITSTVTSVTTDTITSASLPGSFIEDFEATLESIYNDTNPSVVYIEVSDGSGSGFVWDKNGNIVTNNHVVDGADDILVVFSDGTSAEASLIGQDVDSDLAVIKVDTDAGELDPVSLADSTQLKVGQLVVAIGNPYGLQGTLTVGHVSSLGRLLPVSDNPLEPSYSIPDVIQTDAAINPGNSGGVLLDIKGRVVGVTSSIISESGSSAGIGFAIPSVIVQKVVPALISTGRYEHPYLGISVVTLSPDIAQAMNLPSNQRGALVQTVTAGSPAETAGVRASQNTTVINGLTFPVGGDVIISYDTQKVNDSNDLVTFLARSGVVGQTVTLSILRNGQETQLQVILGTRPD